MASITNADDTLVIAGFQWPKPVLDLQVDSFHHGSHYSNNGGDYKNFPDLFIESLSPGGTDHSISITIKINSDLSY